MIGSDETHSVRDLAERAFACVGLDWRKYVETDPRLLRPAEVDTLCADSSKARRVLGWQPEVSFEALIDMMVEADLKRVEREIKQANR